MTSEPESSPVVPAEETKWWEIHAELQVNNKLCYFENCKANLDKRCSNNRFSKED